jgi:hypothetical protein
MPPCHANPRPSRKSLGALSRSGLKRRWLVRASVGLLDGWLAASASAADLYVKQAGWVDTMVGARAALATARLPAPAQEEATAQVWARMKDDFALEWDWTLQDAGTNFTRWFRAGRDTSTERALITAAVNELGDPGEVFRQELEWLIQTQAPAGSRLWLDLYVRCCEQRRQQRLRTVWEKAPRIIFTKHRTVRPATFVCTEAQSDAQGERHFLPGAELCLLEMSGLYGKTRPLVTDPSGVIRDPAVSWDGQRVVFAWKKSLREDDFHLFELEPPSQDVRQVTSGLGVADYEPACLPSGDLLFASTRCVQTLGCGWAEVSDLYVCSPEGRFLRRLGFDQAHALYPQVLDDGRVIYTRWGFNDRGQGSSPALFQMNPDGTAQAEFYGNAPPVRGALVHARGIPGTRKLLAILCQPSGPQAGTLAMIDPAKGRQEDRGLTMVRPPRTPPGGRPVSDGQAGELWQYPFPLNETEFLITGAPLGWNQAGPRRDDADFGIYWMDVEGRRELLAADPRLPCNQPVPMTARPRPWLRANRVDYRQAGGTFYLQNIYAGAGLAGVPRGTIKKLRVVTFDFRAAGIGHNGSSGPGGTAQVSTPASIGNGSWDVKFIVGETKVHEDGSALFTVPARVPVYFQALDERGCAVQTMRNWSTLQPGEYGSCVGCHEHKNTVPPTEDYSFSLAMKAGAHPVTPFYGPPRGFSFRAEIQPILDRHCIRCHKDRAPIHELFRGPESRPLLEQKTTASSSKGGNQDEAAFSLLGEVTVDPVAKRKWSDAYLVLTQARLASSSEAGGSFQGDPQGRMVNWIGSQSASGPLPPYFAGAARSELLKLLQQGHHEVKLSREELEKIAAWIDLLVPYCGDYLEANAWTKEELGTYRRFAEKRRQMEEADQESINELLSIRSPGRRPAPVGRMMR